MDWFEISLVLLVGLVGELPNTMLDGELDAPESGELSDSSVGIAVAP